MENPGLARPAFSRAFDVRGSRWRMRLRRRGRYTGDLRPVWPPSMSGCSERLALRPGVASQEVRRGGGAHGQTWAMRSTAGSGVECVGRGWGRAVERSEEGEDAEMRMEDDAHMHGAHVRRTCTRSVRGECTFRAGSPSQAQARTAIFRPSPRPIQSIRCARQCGGVSAACPAAPRTRLPPPPLPAAARTSTAAGRARRRGHNNGQLGQGGH